MPITVNIPDTLRKAVESASRDKMTVLYDAKGYPSYMVVIPTFNLSAIDAGWPATPHPAFTVHSVAKTQIFVGAYQASLLDGNAIAVPGVIPAVNINFDNSRTACANKGAGWHLMTNAKWSAVALWCWKHGVQPRGNNNWGMDYAQTNEQGQRGDNLAPSTRRETARPTAAPGLPHGGTMALPGVSPTSTAMYGSGSVGHGRILARSRSSPTTTPPTIPSISRRARRRGRQFSRPGRWSHPEQR